jgi:hypothetical protein
MYIHTYYVLTKYVYLSDALKCDKGAGLSGLSQYQLCLGIPPPPSSERVASLLRVARCWDTYTENRSYVRAGLRT